ncbi:MAG: hypothetical protein Q9167_004690 [Letrouitia subvulpina]
MGLESSDKAVDTAESASFISKQDKPPLFDVPTYVPPKTGFLSHLPPAWVPYAQLMRLDRPGGFYAFYFPYLIGLAYAAYISPHPPTPSFLLDRAALFFVGCVILRGSACTWNDNIDQDFDRQVARCRLRPIARGAVSTTQAHVFTFVQTLLGSLLFLALPPMCAVDAVPITLLFGLYPYGKRFTNYPQFILGFPFAWAIVMASHAVGIDPLARETYIPTLCLFFANVLWTMIYDTIYAHQDIKDDTKAGVKSMAVRFAKSTKILTSVLAVGVIGLLTAAGVLMRASVVYFVMTCAGTAVSLAAMIGLVDLETPASCGWWFKWGFWFVGGSLVGGLLAEYLGRL